MCVCVWMLSSVREHARTHVRAHVLQARFRKSRSDRRLRTVRVGALAMLVVAVVYFDDFVIVVFDRIGQPTR